MGHSREDSLSFHCHNLDVLDILMASVLRDAKPQIKTRGMGHELIMRRYLESGELQKVRKARQVCTGPQ